MAASATNERVSNIDDHTVHSRRTNVSLSVSDVLFSTVLWERSAEVSLGFTVSPYSVFQDFHWFLNEPLNKFPPTMKHVAWGLSCFPWWYPDICHLDNCHPDNCHRKTATYDNCHPGPRTTATYDNCHSGQLQPQGCRGAKHVPTLFSCFSL